MALRKPKTRQPRKNGTAKVPVILQLEALECGAACLAMILAYYGKWIPLEQVRIDCGVSRDGSKASRICAAATRYGLTASGFRMEPDALKTEGTFPCIVHWNFNHFVVVNGFRGDKVLLTDPARGPVAVSMEEFDNAFTGVCLFFEPGPDFVPSGKRRSTLDFARKRLAGTGAAVLFVTLIAVAAHLFSLISPVMTRVFFDHLLTGDKPQWLYPFLGILAFVSVLQIVTEWIRVVCSLRINGKMSVVGSTSFIWKVLRLPLEFFSQRMLGDILQREDANASVAGTLIDVIAPLALDTAMMFFYLFVMLRYSVLMTLIGVVSILINLITIRLLAAKRINLARIRMRDMGKLSSATMTGISMTETIRASGAENGFFRKWAGYQASVNEQNVRFAQLDASVGLIPSVLNSLSGYVVLYLGIRLAMEGHFSVGMITAFQAYLRAFIAPAMTLIRAGQTIQEMRTQMERIEDVMEYPDDPFVRSGDTLGDTDYSKLRGGLELRGVTFGYSRLSPPVVSDFSMTLRPGSRVAIVGASGCGKSTLGGLIAGLYQPWSGEILFDGKPIGEIPRSVFTGSVAVVDQDITLFEDTISANIRMWDDTIEDFEVILAARDAQIHDDILQRPGGYRSMLTENGLDLSGGQRQRLEIARVLAQDPSLIILDEATSALDATTEHEVVNAIRDRGITCIVIAHRLSTIRDCDEIIVLDKGRIAERGTHSELYAAGGLYTELVTSE